MYHPSTGYMSRVAAREHGTWHAQIRGGNADGASGRKSRGERYDMKCSLIASDSPPSGRGDVDEGLFAMWVGYVAGPDLRLANQSITAMSIRLIHIKSWSVGVGLGPPRSSGLLDACCNIRQMEIEPECVSCIDIAPARVQPMTAATLSETLTATGRPHLGHWTACKVAATSLSRVCFTCSPSRSRSWSNEIGLGPGNKFS
jgi:hypothetical protein